MKELDTTSRKTQSWKRMFNDHPEWFATKEDMAASANKRCGVTERSPLLDLPYFCLVDDITVDALHMLHGGITKRTWFRMFEPPGLPFKDAAERVSVSLQFNSILTRLKLPTEHRHKARDGLKYAKIF